MQKKVVVSAGMQVYDTAECCTGRLYCSVIIRMYAIDSIAIFNLMMMKMKMIMMCLFYTTLYNEAIHVAAVYESVSTV
jgi:hypothetical protein